ncbi:MAG: VWA domain-containing protein [Rhodocyclaceae bacterium]|nr:VWA domain-containing protein [Rhodocyclaceae bacterium]MCP5241554.1 VWA domain-containing protein [Zoogloeaceae bacterium]MCP5256101.1 VWA domain-containing protein [Zoogloeaceae bacterium]
MPITRLRPLACAVLMLSLAACGTAPEAQRHGDAAPAPRPESPVAATPGVHEEGRVAREQDAVAGKAAPLASAPAPVRDQAVAKRSTMAQASVLGATGYHRLPPPPEASRERYAELDQNGVVATATQPFSTFSIDVDTGAYANVRRMIMAGQLPPDDAVRIEEMINYFPWESRPVARRGEPFAVHTELTPAPWNADRLLLRVGVRAMDAVRSELPPANLVFLVDVSGSMTAANKLPLLKNALRLLTDTLRPQDRVSLVTYASGTRVVLPPTPGSERGKIRAALEELRPGGSTAGEAGIRLAYEMARQAYREEGINRILLATDGDFNVGLSDFEALKALVEDRRKSGVSLTTLGFGTGNYREDLMERLADAGDGNYAYIDTLNEAHKVLVEEAASTLSIVARDVKIQMEFNPAVVSEYRLIGYENRALAREDFRNDKVDAGEVGAGHGVTALYELSLVGQPGMLGESRYARPAPVVGHGDELGMLRLRYKQPAGGAANEIEVAVKREQIRSAAAASTDLRFTAAVAAFGQHLRGGKYLGSFGPEQIERLAAGARGEDRFGYRGEFLRLVKLAGALETRPSRGCSTAREDGQCAE